MFVFRHEHCEEDIRHQRTPFEITYHTINYFLWWIKLKWKFYRTILLLWKVSLFILFFSQKFFNVLTCIYKELVKFQTFQNFFCILWFTLSYINILLFHFLFFLLNLFSKIRNSFLLLYILLLLSISLHRSSSFPRKRDPSICLLRFFSFYL